MSKIYGVVTDSRSNQPIVDAEVSIKPGGTAAAVIKPVTDKSGRYVIDHLVPGSFDVSVNALGQSKGPDTVDATKDVEKNFTLDVGADIAMSLEPTAAGTPAEPSEGSRITLSTALRDRTQFNYKWTVGGGTLVEKGNEQNAPTVHWDTTGMLPGPATVTLTISGIGSPSLTVSASLNLRSRPLAQKDVVPVTMRRTATTPTNDLPLWVLIRRTTEEIGFENYRRFMDLVLCGIDETGAPDGQKQAVHGEFHRLLERRALPYNDAEAYRALKVATEAFLMVKCGVALPVVTNRRLIERGFRETTFTSDDLAELIHRVSLDATAVNLDTLWRSYLQPIINGDEDATIPYLALIREKLGDVRLKHSFFSSVDHSLGDQPQAERCFGILRSKLTNPCLLELIWSYWHEEGMLVQTMNVLSLRFQNIRSAGPRDPLAMLEIDPLRPLNNLLWGYIQDEQHRLSVVRRAYEYDHHYGLTLYGKAVPALRAADSRSKFLEVFHNLLYLCWLFFKEDDDTTVIADGFPILNALKDVHLQLAEGAHNQFGDLPSTARQEMLLQQWLLARPEFREFLPTRIMVAYPEPWMDRVDAMKRLQGWTDESSTEFHDLAVFGEQILLSVRFGAWLTVDDPVQAANWARFWRAEIQGYVHSYRAVTGVDLTTEAADSREAARRATQPAILLRERLVSQSPNGKGAALPAAGPRERLAVRRRSL